MQSKAASVEQYLKSLDPQRRAVVSAVRDVVNANVDPAFEEGMQYGMIGWYLPHSRYPAGYHCDPKQPLPFAGLASQKQHFSLYMMGLYVCPDMDERAGLAHWFRTAWENTGRKLDMGKACVRFKKLDDVALDVVAEAFRVLTAAKYVQRYEAALAQMGKSPDGKRSGKPAAKASAKAPAKSAAKSAAKSRPGARAKPAAKAHVSAARSKAAAKR